MEAANNGGKLDFVENHDEDFHKILLVTNLFGKKCVFIFIAKMESKGYRYIQGPW